MEYMYELKEKLCKELDEIARKPEMGAGDLEIIHKLTDTIKNLDKIGMLEDGYSQAGDWEIEGRAYNRGSSYARRKRDSMGRYSRDGRAMHYRNGRMYSRAEAKEDIMDQIEDMMGDADEKEKTILRRAMTELEKV